MKSIISSVILLTCVVGGLAQPHHKKHHKAAAKAKDANKTGAAAAPASSAPAAVQNPPTGASGPALIVVKESSPDAAANWAKDTAVVSNFLNLAPTLKGTAFVAQAKIALNAELNELSHKANLDADPAVTSNPTIAAANNSLVTLGHFQDVVDLLRIMSEVGDSSGVRDSDDINLNRCANVLPSIDAYLKAAGTDFRSARPFNCDVNGRIATGAPGKTKPFAGYNPDSNDADDTVPI
ncbi:MAG: hypothetical protein GOMPHAMPRED_006502 [Gomphillus americanus]|uniref:Uncharacterized protein n=1 Tax=Gomphillus americanus TaxID=1940652 RepID=A0A8H3IU08_9LECA|nr:MAG: hypothetical protein GOMPHAMPRED_006502 [Gomphillus americanus]